MQIDLAATEGKGGAPRAKRHRLHTQDAGVEVHGGVDVDDGQHQMVEPVDTDGSIVGGCCDHIAGAWSQMRIEATSPTEGMTMAVPRLRSAISDDFSAVPPS
jgi:hypothetical protein